MGLTPVLMYPDDAPLWVGAGSHIAKQIEGSGRFYEYKMLDAIRRKGLRGTYLDIGANVGNHTVFFADFCKSKRVVAFEPAPLNLGLLEMNASSRKNIRIVPKAVSEIGGEVEIDGIGVTGPVSSVPLAPYLTADVAVVKMDVEGWEIPILRGALDRLNQVRPLLAVECIGGVASATYAEQTRMLQSIGYRMERVYNATPTMIWAPG